ncbi:MAG: hypothetical protein L0Z53_13510 [Acidobacteriales bacterium]|nr:hypothetical protein [Terriglobales bacterium]
MVRTLYLFALLSASFVQAQTIQPLLSEYRNEANGSLRLTNDAFLPTNVVLEAKSFEVTEDGDIVYRPLDSGIEVKFAAKSFRIQPKQTYTVNYVAKAKTLPAYFVIYAAFSGKGLQTDSGLNVNVLLPHTVYILPKNDAAKRELQVQASFDKEAGKIRLRVDSASDAFGRVLMTEVVGEKKKIEDAGFPVYPHKSREFEVDWKENEAPRKLVLHFRNFKLESPL